MSDEPFFPYFYLPLPPFTKYRNENQKTILTLRSGGETAVHLEKDAAHSKNPLLDQLEIIAEALSLLLGEKNSFTESEQRSLAHIRKMTRLRKAKKGKKGKD